MISKWFSNVPRYTSKFTHRLASLSRGFGPNVWRVRIYNLCSVAHSLWRADRSNKNSIKSVVFCPAFLQLLRKMDMGYKSHHLFLIYLRYCSVLWFNKGILWVCNKIQISVLHLDSTRNQPYLSFLSFLNFWGMTPHFWRR